MDAVFQLMMSMPWKSPPQVDSEWKKKVASEMLSSLSEARCVFKYQGWLGERCGCSVRDALVCRCVWV